MIQPFHTKHRRASALRLLTVLALAAVLGLAGCKKDQEDQAGVTAEEYYAQAKRALDLGSYDRAILLYKQMQTYYPFGRYTEQAQLELAYAYHKAYEPEAALAQADRFIRTYPSHPNVDYAYYLRGLIHYEQNASFFDRWLPERKRDRDQTAAREAFNDFEELIRRFPESRYAPDAKQRMIYLRNNLATYEIYVAEYYLRRKAYIAAANRGRYVIETFPGSPMTPEALRVMHEAYTGLQMDELAEDAWRVLALNYPEHPYVTGQGDSRNWLTWLWPFD